MEHLTYFDNSATSWPKPPQVVQAVADYMTNLGVSPGRGTYQKAREADRLLYQTRKSVARLLDCPHPTQIIFTHNSTEAINLALKGSLKPGQRVLTTAAEHNAVWRPLNTLLRDRGIVLHAIPVSAEGVLDLEAAEQFLRDGIDLGVFVHGSNVIGSVFPMAELTALCHQYGARVLVDASQTAGAWPISVSSWDVDMLAFTGHKGLLGPTGTGGLYIKKVITLNTLKEGGTGSMSVSPFPPDTAPDRYEAGTVNMSGLAGLRCGVEHLLSVGVESVAAQEGTRIQQLLDAIYDLPGVTLYSPKPGVERLGLVSLNVHGRDPYEVAKELDAEFGIMARAGLHCAPQAHRCIGTIETGTLRLSLGIYHTEADIAYLAEAIRTVAERGN